MVISDLHYEKRVFRGHDESRAWGWLMGIVDYHRPDVLLGCGDWGTAVNPKEFYELLRKTVILTIYGNHENMSVLTSLYNVKSSSYLPIPMEDGRVYEIGGLRIAGVNGIISKRRMKKGVPRKRAEEFIAVAEKLKGENVDVLLMHETPYLKELFPHIAYTINSKTAYEFVEKVKPKVVINGHMHSGGYKTYTFPWGTQYIYLDSSQQSRHYLVFEDLDVIEVWQDRRKIDEIALEETTSRKNSVKSSNNIQAQTR